MINVKLIVILFDLILFTKSRSYCEICPNHILCQFTMTGPSVNCNEYDTNSLLTNKDTEIIVRRINERRNFIARGLSKYFPSAANMNKIYWSDELATFAQRWIDQCDPNVLPDKEDECRDLDGTRVGQNIISILGPSPGLLIQSLIDVWFTRGLEFKGNLSCYNHLKDCKTNYFTQLIWAETNRVGCGKAKFYLKKRNTMIERLVCNFAPRGNIQGKSVYAFGFPATQCQSGTTADNELTALCGLSMNKAARLFFQTPTKSLLRILNLSSNVTKQNNELGGNLKEIKPEDSEVNQKRFQKIRHVPMNNSNAHFKSSPVTRINDKYYIQRNNPKSHRSGSQHLHNKEKEYLRTCNDHVLHENNDNYNLKGKYEQTLKADNFAGVTVAKYLQNSKCTRKLQSKIHSTKKSRYTSPKRCTRKPVNNTYTGNLKNLSFTNISSTECTRRISHEECPCNTPTTTKCHCKNNCQCLNIELSTQLPPTSLLNHDAKYEHNVPEGNYYYDVFPHLAARSGGKHFKLSSKAMLEDSWIEKDYPFDRDKRSANEMPFKPFWQVEELTQKGPLQLKAINVKYTTLPYKRQRSTKHTTSNIRIPHTTEIITVKLKHDTNSAQLNPVTEKYLSFDELMHLRKFGSTATVTFTNGRRNEPNEPKTSSEYTINTPFARKKYCTRKLTCTWTAASITDTNGSIVNREDDHGSRTPPGYVEGCSRTSTCTRDNMNRNKFSTLRDVSATELEDEDYCEKRALNIRKRQIQSKDTDTFFTCNGKKKE
ncbi:hypothetical protein ACJJTC_007722 [Scirpophaga incertulas]